MIYWATDAYYEVRWFFQRLFRGYSDKELWNLDLTVATFILPRLREVRRRISNNKYSGIPAALYDEFKDEKIAFSKWMEILDKIILAFDITVCEMNVDKGLSVHKACTHTVSDMIKCGELQKEGLELFAKYFMFLGDD